MAQKDYLEGMKIFEIFGKTRQDFVDKLKIINIWRIISIGQGKLRKLRANLCAYGPKVKKQLWKFSRKFCDFLIKISIENWLFSQFLLKISWSSAFSPNYPWKIISVFYNNFSYLGGTFRLSPSDATGSVQLPNPVYHGA